MVFPNRSSNRGGRRRGGAASELALLLPLLVLVLIVAIDFCRLFFHYTTITNAARNGALWASDPLANPAIVGLPSQSPYGSVQDAALADANANLGSLIVNNLNPALIAANVTSSGPTNGQVSVTVQYQFNMISTYLGFSNVNLSRQVTMRVAPAAPN
jgi:Flp pilus assembly protein TadG